MDEIFDILKHGGNLSLTISINDLRTFAEQVAEQVAERLCNDSTTEELMTINEVASLLGVTRPTLWRWDRMGYLNKVMVGNRIRYRRDDINKLIINKKNQTK